VSNSFFILNSAFASRHGQFIKDFPDDRFGIFNAKTQRRREFQLFQPRERGLAAGNGWCNLSNMPITLDQIVEETSEMPGEVVAELIDRIMVARHGGIEPSVAESWKAETDRRIAEIESGKVKGITPEENAARIQKILRR
jgi:putative addiction module component (TIGR02574 family)